MKHVSAFILRLALILFLVLALSSGAAMAESYDASTMRLLRHEGTVEIFDVTGATRFLMDNVRFMSGESMRTGSDGQASVSLDDTKIVSLDTDTRVEFIQEAGHMQLNLLEGSLFLDVQKKLDENESFDIQTTTMTVGIRGTLIVASERKATKKKSAATTVAVLEGGGRFSFTDPSGAKRVVDVAAGQKVVIPKTESKGGGVSPEVSDMTGADLPEYAAKKILSDTVLTDRVVNGSNNGEQILYDSGESEDEEKQELFPADGDWTWGGTVTLVAQSASKLYDGKPLMRPSGALVYGLPGNFSIQVSCSGSITNAGSTDNVISSYSIFNSSGENVTGHFSGINKVNGSLVVDPAPLVVWTGSSEKVYDGEPLTCDEAGIRTVPGHTSEDPAWKNTSLVTETALGSEKMIALSGSTYVHGTNPLTGQTQQLELKAGQSLSVCLHDEGSGQSLEFQITNLKEDELPEEVLRVYAKNPDLLAEACAQTGWNPDVMASLIKALPPAKDSSVVSGTGLKVPGVSEENLMTDSTNVRIKIDSDITNYTTRALTGEEADFTPIAVDSSIVVTATGSRTEVGEDVNTYTIDWGKANPDNYILREDLGTLTVTQPEASIRIVPGSAEKTYDGKALTSRAVSVYGLPAGYAARVTVSGSITDVGTAQNRVSSYTILNGDKEDVTSQFTNIHLGTGTLTVKPAELTVVTGSARKAYDGKPLRSNKVQVSGLADGESVTVKTTGSVTAAGSASNTCSISWDTAKESNYTVSKTLGTLTVDPLSMEINCGGGKVDYSGYDFDPQPVLSYLNGTHAGESVPGEKQDEFIFATGRAAGYLASSGLRPRRVRAEEYEHGAMRYVFSLFTGDTVELTLAGIGSSVGTYTLTGSVKSTMEDVNIDLELTGTAVTISPIEVTITSGSAEKPYDGTPLTSDEVTVKGLPEEQMIVVTPAGTVTNVGTAVNEFTVDWLGLDPENYVVTETYGTLTVKPMELAFDLHGGEVTYGRYLWSPPTLNGVLPGTDESPYLYLLPAEGESITLTVSGGLQPDSDVGEYTAEYGWELVGDPANYSVSVTGESSVVSPAVISISTQDLSKSKTYDKEPLILNIEEELDVEGYPDIHYVLKPIELVDAGRETIKIDILWGDEDESNYSVNYQAGALEIARANLTIVSGSRTKFYDGVMMTCEEAEISGLLPDETISLEYTGSQIDAGCSDNTYIVTWVTAKESNYNLQAQTGDLDILPSPLTLRSATISESNYFGILTNGEHELEVVEGPLYSRDHLEVEFTASIDGSKVEVTESVSNAFNIIPNASSKNYEITKIYGSLTVINEPATIPDDAYPEDTDGMPSPENNGRSLPDPQDTDDPPKADADDTDDPPPSDPDNSGDPPQSDPEQKEDPPKSDPDVTDNPPKSDSDNSDSPPKSDPEQKDDPPKSDTDNTDDPPKTDPDASDTPPQSDPEQKDDPPKSDTDNTDNPPKSDQDKSDTPSQSDPAVTNSDNGSNSSEKTKKTSSSPEKTDSSGDTKSKEQPKESSPAPEKTNDSSPAPSAADSGDDGKSQAVPEAPSPDPQDTPEEVSSPDPEPDPSAESIPVSRLYRNNRTCL